MVDTIEKAMLHVIPRDDWFAHTEEGTECACGPTLDETETCINVIHASYDGREHLEKDHDWHNCAVCQEDVKNLETTTNGW